MRIYTSLDPALQRAAAEAVEAGTKQIDELIRRQRTRNVKTGSGKDSRTQLLVLPGPEAQSPLSPWIRTRDGSWPFLEAGTMALAS